MIEGTPGKPYGGLLAHFNIVEANMRHRREEVSQLLKPDETVMSLTSFPRLGCENFTDPPTKPTPDAGATRSLFFPDDAIFPGHPRFKTLSRNIRLRRGDKVAINIPIFKDKNTAIPVDDSYKHSKAALPDHVYMDAMGFGMGCCCLQLTFQACNITEARTLYDQLTPLCPIMLAFTAASPLHRGFLTDVDCRWNIISASVDCRTEEERGLKPLKQNKFVIKKSRYDSIDSYLSEQGEKYNDVPLLYNEEDYKKLTANGIDHLLAQHIAHLFIRDTVSLFSEKVNQNDEEDTDHFENIQSTNWQTMRFKPPPPNSTIGWRVEFRPCEVQFTDFENAAIVCFVVLLTRVILSYQLNFLIPISKLCKRYFIKYLTLERMNNKEKYLDIDSASLKVDENMQKAQKRNAAREEKFWFRKDITTHVSPPEANECCKKGTMNCEPTNCDMFSLLTVNEIINGKEAEFPGLIPLINSYLSGMDVDADTHCTIQQYLKFIQRRASGEIFTTASWIRKFVTEHPEYMQDSKVTERINFDLLETIKDIQLGNKPCPDLLGYSTMSKTKENIPNALFKDC
ncbi:hypothetical protein NQ315_008107 [Exocentrus adspersus]|uniref:Glutamate--cysteine ligase n=1 Tax=Exocentrus adspersus TaxID=1586481 RepID=A0AAV8VWU7_9CUCU|nr:hypothetical protein NQ315_008107 [Exocentrus adspersus]